MLLYSCTHKSLFFTSALRGTSISAIMRFLTHTFGEIAFCKSTRAFLYDLNKYGISIVLFVHLLIVSLSVSSQVMLLGNLSVLLKKLPTQIRNVHESSLYAGRVGSGPVYWHNFRILSGSDPSGSDFVGTANLDPTRLNFFKQFRVISHEIISSIILTLLSLLPSPPFLQSLYRLLGLLPSARYKLINWSQLIIAIMVICLIGLQLHVTMSLEIKQWID